MIRAILRYKTVAAIATVGLLGVAGCSSGGSGANTSQSGDVGVVSMPLQTVTNGATYRLTNFEVEISGPVFQILEESDPTESVLSTTVPTGTYSAEVFNGFTLEKEAADGSFQPVTATLVSSSFFNFTVYNGTTTTLTFEFRTDGVTVEVGMGTVDFVTKVDQVDAACAALGTTCGAGSWCPPSTLTGSDLACVPAGKIAVGQPCSQVSDCVANSTCVASDAAQGVCTALCLGADFGSPCASGGTCTQVTSEYGTCQ